MIKTKTLIVICLLLLSACGVNVKEPQRVTSPDGKLDAVFRIESGGGAAGFVFYEVHLVPAGDPVSGDGDCFVSMRGALETILKWTGDKQLEVTYIEGASIKAFNNYYWMEDERGQISKSRRYEIVLNRVTREEWEMLRSE